MDNTFLENFAGLITNTSKIHIAPNNQPDNTNKTVENDKPDQSNLPVTKEPDLEHEKNGSISITSRLFDPIAKTNVYAIIMVILLRDNAPDKILELISKLPFIGAAGFIGRIALDKPLKWLNHQIKAQGEAYIMENLVERWKANNITYDELSEKIENIPASLLTDSIKLDAINLLNIYYLNIRPLVSEQIYTTKIANIDGTICCKFCGTINKHTAKFCCECGHTLLKEKVCIKCNWILLPNFRFCPICGTKIPDTIHKLISNSILDVQHKSMRQYNDLEDHASLGNETCNIKQTKKVMDNYFWKLATKLYESEKNNSSATHTSLTFIHKSFLYIWKHIHEDDGKIAKEVWDDLNQLLMDEDNCFNILILFYSRITYLIITTQKDADIQKRSKMLLTKSIIYIGNSYFINLEKKGKIAKINPEAIKQQIISKFRGYVMEMMSKQKNMNDIAISLLSNIKKSHKSDLAPANLIESIVVYVKSRDHFLIQFIKLIIHEDFYSI